MNDKDITVADIMPVKPEDNTSLKSGKWENFKKKLSEEFKGIKWTASMPELAEKIGELLNIKIPGLLKDAWTKTESIKEAIDETHNTPGKTAYVELYDHTIKSEHEPYIEIRISGIPNPNKIIFKLLMSFNLKSIILKIQEGLIKEIQGGTCTAEGELSFRDLTLAKKELFELKLPKLMQ